MKAERRHWLWRRLPQQPLHSLGFDPLSGLAVFLILAFIVIECAGGVVGAPWIFVQMGLSADGVMHGKLWQFLSYACLHGNGLHLSLNLLMLWLLGGRVAHILGWSPWLKIVFGGVVLGGVFHVWTGAVLSLMGQEESYLVGISAGCFALLLTLTTLSPESRMWPVPVSGKNLGMGILLSSLLLVLIQPELGLPGLSRMGGVMVALGGAGVFEVSHACHLGGAIAGWLYARWLLSSPPSLEDLQKQRVEFEVQESSLREKSKSLSECD